MKFRNIILTSALTLINLVVIVDYIYLQHKTRNKFIELQALLEQKQNLDADWGRLQIQHSTLVNNSRIEQVTKDKLGMVLPDSKNILSIKR